MPATTKHNGHEPETARLIAGYLKDTPEDQMQETTYIPLRMVHALSILQALEGQFDKLQEQLVEIKTWQARKIHPEYNPPEISEDEEPVKQSHDLFIHKFRKALHQYFRGKDGMFLEKMVILADTDLQTRSLNTSELFNKKIREQ